MTVYCSKIHPNKEKCDKSNELNKQSLYSSTRTVENPLLHAQDKSWGGRQKELQMIIKMCLLWRATRMCTMVMPAGFHWSSTINKTVR